MGLVSAGRGGRAGARRTRQLAYVVTSNTAWHGDVHVRDLTAGADRLLRSRAVDPSWSADGKSVVVEDVGGEADMNGPPLILDAATGREVRRMGPSTGGEVPLMSPDQRYVAACVRMSRPKFAPHIVDVRSGEVRHVPQEGGPVLAWSSDSRWLAWTRWILLRDNNGAYSRLEVWISSSDARRSHRIDTGYPAAFAPDARHVLYVRGGEFSKQGDLVVADLQGRHQRVLARGVDPVIALTPPPTPRSPAR